MQPTLAMRLHCLWAEQQPPEEEFLGSPSRDLKKVPLKKGGSS
jgi:hypothetical protein